MHKPYKMPFIIMCNEMRNLQNRNPGNIPEKACRDFHQGQERQKAPCLLSLPEEIQQR